MKGKILLIVTAFLFGATMLAAPIVMAAEEESTAPMEEKAPEKAPAKKKAKKAKKAKAKKAKKKASKKKEEAPEPSSEEK